ncbi:MAG: tautomerase family protein, partial [Streptosporangiaceae bacterium]
MSDRPAKRKFYKTLVRLLEESPGVRPADVFVMMTITRPENFSFADRVIVTDIAAAEPLDLAAQTPGTRDAYTKAEMTAAITELFENRDRHPILPMLRDDVVLKVPATLPYGGEFTGPGITGGSPAFSSTPTPPPSSRPRPELRTQPVGRWAWRCCFAWDSAGRTQRFLSRALPLAATGRERIVTLLPRRWHACVPACAREQIKETRLAVVVGGAGSGGG